MATRDWSVDDCTMCHATAATPAFIRSQHAKVEQSCAGCHQNVDEHLKAQQEGTADGPVPWVKALSVEQANSTCLSCHEKGGQATWLSSMHDRRKVACTSCHSIHDFKSVKAQLKTRQDAETCYTCHKSQRAKGMRTSTIPSAKARWTARAATTRTRARRPRW